MDSNIVRSPLMFALVSVLAHTGSPAQSGLRVDPAFSTTFDDLVIPTVSICSHASSVLPLSNGQVIAAGMFYYGPPTSEDLGYVSLVRLNADGSRDLSFAGISSDAYLVPWNEVFYSGPYPRRHFSDGTVDYSFSLLNAPDLDLYPFSYHVCEDGSVVVVGEHTISVPGGGTVEHFGACKLDPTGALDDAFLRATLSTDALLTMVKGISGDRFIMGGSLSSYAGVSTGCIIRTDANGELDTTFHVAGFTGYPYDLNEFADGSVLLVGRFADDVTHQAFHVVKLLSDGTVDPSFDHHLTFTWDFAGIEQVYVRRVAPYGEEGLLLVGGFDGVNGHPHGGIVGIDADGHVLEDGTAVPGCGAFQLEGVPYGGINAIAQGPDGAYYAGGAFQGYSDVDGENPDERVIVRLRSITTGVAETVVHTFSLFPNPASEIVELRSIGPLGSPLYVDVVDDLGRIISSFRPTGYPFRLDVSTFTPGMYLIRPMFAQGPGKGERFVVE